MVLLPNPNPTPLPHPPAQSPAAPPPLTPPTTTTTLLILGAGWTSLFLLPLLRELHIPHVATTRDGRAGTLPFVFDPASRSLEPYRALPRAQTVLVTFPLSGRGQSRLLLEMYAAAHGQGEEAERRGVPTRWIQLGSTGIWGVGSTASAVVAGGGGGGGGGVDGGREGGGETPWLTRHSPYDNKNPRAIAEDELLALGGCVLNLSGLWGGTRQPRAWVDRVAGTKEALGGKGSLHLVHGYDVARAVVAVMKAFTPGERWMLTDLMVYDWWALVLGWAGGDGENDDGGEKSLRQLQWVQELLGENDIKALPRSPEQLKRCYDSREFWSTFKLMPVKSVVR